MLFVKTEKTKLGVGPYMAFGFGFNKQKALGTAEKNVQQGKLQNAINEYEKVLKADPKDLTVMNTVGVESIHASAIAVTRFVAPGPDVAIATPTLPDARA